MKTISSMLKALLMFSLFLLSIFCLYLAYSGNYYFILYTIVPVSLLFHISRSCGGLICKDGKVCLDFMFHKKEIDIYKSSKIKIYNPGFNKHINVIILYFGSFMNYYMISETDGNIKKYIVENAIRREVTNFYEVFWLKEQ